MSTKTERYAPWIALPVVAVLAFGLGGWLLGDSGAPQEVRREHQPHAAETIYTCSMHPQIRQDGPGQCPICGMDLIAAETAAREDGMAARVSLSERAKILARIRTVEAHRLGSQGVQRRLLGRVDYDETSLRTVTAWIGGRIERLHVGATGERVKRGRGVADPSTPEIYNPPPKLV